jgi:hypothetical protein
LGKHVTILVEKRRLALVGIILVCKLISRQAGGFRYRAIYASGSEKAGSHLRDELGWF